jgi:hypothetical protein
MRRRTGQAGEKAPKTWAFGCRAGHHLCAEVGRGRRQSHPLSQRLHSTRVVARVDILWHASAHKRNPLFRRWAPALNTRRPEGSLDVSSYYQGKAAGDPSSRHSTDQPVRALRTLDESAFSSIQRHAGDGHALQKERACWVPRGREVCASITVDTRGSGAGELFRYLPRLA